jgi:hypothetical protein
MNGQAWYSTVIVMLLIIGFMPAIAFISQHRPRQWRRMAAWDASGWVILVALWYFRSIVLVWTRWPGSPPKGLGDAAVSIGLLALLDFLLILRVISYRSFAQRDAERVADGRDDAIT